MTEERYQLITKGELLDGFSQEQVSIKLAKIFNTTEKSISRIFSSKKQIIVKDVSWNKAIKYRKQFKSVGLVIYLDVILQASIFRESLIAVTELKTENINNKKNNSTAQSENDLISELQFMKFNVDKLNPIFVYPPHTETIFDKQDRPKFTIKSINHKINFKFILVFSMVASLLIQKYFTMLLVLYLPDTVVTIISIVIFFLIIIILPKVMMPCRIFTITKSKDDTPYLLCAQSLSYNLFVDEYIIYSPDGDYLASIKNNRLKSQYQCFDSDGNCVYTSTEEHNIDDFTKGVTKELRDELFDFSFVSYINSVSHYYKNLVAWLKKQPQQYQKEDAYIVRDSDMKKTAYFYRGKMNAMEIPVNKNSKEPDKIMMAFLLICLGID